MPQGSVKEYHVNEKVGIIASDDGLTEWEIDPIAIDTGMFRFFQCRPEGHLRPGP